MIPIVLVLTFGFASGGFVGNWEVLGDVNNANCIVYDGQYLWLGTEGGVVRFGLDGEYRIYTTIDGLGGLSIPSLCVDDEGRVWYVSRDGYVGVFIGGEWKTAEDLAANFYSLNKVKFYSGSLWIATDRGIIGASPVPESFSVVQFRDFIERFADLPAQVPVSDIEFLHDTVFVATEYGIAFAPIGAELTFPGAWDTAAVVDTLTTGTVVSRGAHALGVHHDTLWVLSYQDRASALLFYFSDGQVYKKNLSAQFVRSYAYDVIDVNDTLWVMYGDGIFFYSPSDNRMHAIVLNASRGGAKDMVSAGEINYLATFYGLGVLADTSYVKSFNTILGSSISDLTFLGDTVFVTTNGVALNIYSNGEWEFLDYYTLYSHLYSTVDTSVINAVKDLFWRIKTGIRTPDGTIWLGSYGRGILKVYPDFTVEIWNETNSCLSSSGESDHYPVANRLRIDPWGNLWVMCYQSNDNAPIKVWPADKLDDPYGAVSFQVGRGIPHKAVRAIACDWDKVAVATAYGGGIIYYNGTVEDTSDDEYINLVGLLPSDECNAVAITPDGRVWFGTAAGLAYWDPAGYVVNVPLPEDLSATVMSLAADSMGNLWIGTLDGAALYMSDGYFSTFKSFHSDDAPLADRTPLLDDAVGILGGSIIGGVYTDGKSGDVWFGFNEGLVVLHSPYGTEAEPESLVIYPNPAVAERGIMPVVHIGNIPPEAPVLIYDAAGNLVKEIPHFWKGHTGFVAWDCTNSNGKKVAPGIYTIVAPGQNRILRGKLMIVR